MLPVIKIIKIEKNKHKCKFISLISGPPRHRCQLQSHEHHEFLRQRLVRAYRCRGFQIGPLQQEVHHHLPGDPNRRQVLCLFRLNFVKLSKNTSSDVLRRPQNSHFSFDDDYISIIVIAEIEILSIFVAFSKKGSFNSYPILK